MEIIKNAPHQGTAYMLFSKRMIYDKYSKGEDEKGEYLLLHKNQEKMYCDSLEAALEVHCFDSKREARMIKSRENGIIEKLIPDDSKEYEEYEEYEESVYLLNMDNIDSNEYEGKVGIVNYISYEEENDYLRIDNYRLKEV